MEERGTGKTNLEVLRSTTVNVPDRVFFAFFRSIYRQLSKMDFEQPTGDLPFIQYCTDCPSMQ